MVENFKTFVKDCLRCRVEDLLFTKFCQRIVGPHTKILFLVTYRGEPRCIIKMMRSPSFNEALMREKKAQESIAPHGMCRTPEVYFDGFVCGRYVYAEEVINGLPLTRIQAARYEREIVQFTSSLPSGIVHGDLGTPNILKDDRGLAIIDWEHADENPIYLIDAVYFMARLRRVKNLEDWRRRAMPAFMRYTGVSASEAEVLYSSYVSSKQSKKVPYLT